MAKPPNATDPLFIAGEIDALITFAQVLASISPDRERLLYEFGVAEQARLAKLEMQLARENLVHGFQRAMDRIRTSMEIP